MAGVLCDPLQQLGELADKEEENQGVTIVSTPRIYMQIVLRLTRVGINQTSTLATDGETGGIEWSLNGSRTYTPTEVSIKRCHADVIRGWLMDRINRGGL